ncbi:hypothetical protein L584_07875 [Pantoea agglomerans Tx10]|jgi:hypothetical protein|nr:hypothetical protein L584_07875 [Pantoea agglomerans Tx10]KEY42523.1 hypothetical protein FB99_09750 [Pantoea agglomerans]
MVILLLTNTALTFVKRMDEKTAAIMPDVTQRTPASAVDSLRGD